MTKSFTLGAVKQVTERRARYMNYLASPEWARKREEVLARDGYLCMRCGATSAEAVLEVHHWTYENLGDEPLDDLETFCHGCHAIADEERKEAEEEERHVNAVYTFSDKKFGYGWRNWKSFEDAEEEYLDWLDWARSKGR